MSFDLFNWKSPSDESQIQDDDNNASCSKEVATNNEMTSFDFSNANRQVAPSIQSALETKQFTIRLKESSIESTITFSKFHISKIFEKVQAKYKIKKLENIVFEYSLPLSNGKRKSLFVYNDDEAVESLTSFYCQAEEMSPYPLIVHLERQGKREIRPSEKVYKALMVKNFSADIKFYNMLVDHINITARFKAKREYVSLLLGKKCLNLVSPAHYHCHFQGCDKTIILGAFSKLSLVHRHWEDHSKRSKDDPSSTLVKRYRYVEGTKGGELWLKDADLQSRIKDLNSSNFDGVPLSMPKGKYNFIEAETEFNGRAFLVKPDILDMILKGDKDALSKLPKPKTMKSYFSSSSKHSSSSTLKKSKSTKIDLDSNSSGSSDKSCIKPKSKDALKDPCCSKSSVTVEEDAVEPKDNEGHIKFEVRYSPKRLKIDLD